VRAGEILGGGTAFDGSLWIADRGGEALVRLDPRTPAVSGRFDVPGDPRLVAAGPGGLWAALATPGRDDVTLARVDPESGRVAARADAGPVVALAVAGGSVWAVVEATTDDTPPEGLYRYDAATGALVERIDVLGTWYLAAAGDELWSLAGDGTVVRIDAASGRILDRIRGAVPASGATAAAAAVIADAGGAWVLHAPVSGTTTVARVQGNRVVHRFRLPPGTLPALARTPDGLWIAEGDERRGRYRLTRLDPGSGQATAQLGLRGRRPVALIPAGHRLAVLDGMGFAVVVEPRD
jgi:streptogramin lyase